MEKFFKTFCVRTSRHRQVGPIQVKKESSAASSSPTSLVSDGTGTISDWNTSAKINTTEKPYAPPLDKYEKEMSQVLDLKKTIKPRPGIKSINFESEDNESTQRKDIGNVETEKSKPSSREESNRNEPVHSNGNSSCNVLGVVIVALVVE